MRKKQRISVEQVILKIKTTCTLFMKNKQKQLYMSWLKQQITLKMQHASICFIWLRSKYIFFKFIWLSWFYNDITTLLASTRHKNIIQCMQSFTKRLKYCFIREQFALGWGWLLETLAVYLRGLIWWRLRSPISYRNCWILHFCNHCYVQFLWLSWKAE